MSLFKTLQEVSASLRKKSKVLTMSTKAYMICLLIGYLQISIPDHPSCLPYSSHTGFLDVSQHAKTGPSHGPYTCCSHCQENTELLLTLLESLCDNRCAFLLLLLEILLFKEASGISQAILILCYQQVIISEPETNI